MRTILDNYSVHELLDRVNIDYLVTLLLQNRYYRDKIVTLLKEDVTNHQLVEFSDINGADLLVQKYIEDFGESQIVDLLLDANFGHDVACFIVDNFPLSHLDHADSYTFINFTTRL